MAKSKRKKKEKAKDFAKPKLRVGRKLPKANEPDISFTSQSVVIPSQLQTKSNEAKSFRKLTVQDLLSQLHHYSTSVRHDALTGLRDLFRLHPTEIAKHVGILIEQVSTMICDSDATVRHALISTFKEICCLIDNAQMSPFFAMTVAHVISGLSHIHSDVRIDALQILDCLRETYPSLIVSSLPKLIPHLVGLVRQNASSLEKQKYQGSSKAMTSNRVQVLSRLHSFLQVGLNQHKLHTTLQSKSVEFSSTAPTHVVVLKFGCPKQHVQLEAASLFADSTGLNSDCVHHIIVSIVPTLLEWWVECEPSRLLFESSIPTRSLMTMSLILEVIDILWKHASRLDKQSGVLEFRKFLTGLYEKEFVKHFLTYFPFAMTNGGGKRAVEKLGLSGVCPMSASHMNITLCSIMVALNQDNAWLEQIESYLMSIFQNQSQIHKMSVSGFDCLLSTIRLLLEDHSRSYSMINNKLNKTIEPLLSGLVSLFSSFHALSAKKESLLHFLVSILVEPGIADFLREKWSRFSSLMSLWLDSLLPFLLALKTNNVMITETVLKVLCEVLSQSSRYHMQTAVSQWLCEFIDQVAVRLPCHVHQRVCECIYYCEDVPQSLLKSLTGLCNSLSVKTIQYLLQILLYRSLQSPVPCRSLCGNVVCVSDAGLLSFCISLLVGSNQSETSHVQKLNDQTFPRDMYGR
jgi:pre-rRNA-processing protein IPI1